MEIVVCFCVDLRSWWGGFDLLLDHQAGELLSQSLSVFGVGESEHDRVEDGGTLGRAGRDLSCQGGEQFPVNKPIKFAQQHDSIKHLCAQLGRKEYKEYQCPVIANTIIASKPAMIFMLKGKV